MLIETASARVKFILSGTQYFHECNTAAREAHESENADHVGIHETTTRERVTWVKISQNKTK
jgi:hypothetical protein